MEDNNNKRDENATHYYSYGPYNSSKNSDSSGESTTAKGADGVSDVDVSPPRAVRMYESEPLQPTSIRMDSWQFEKKKRSSFTSVFAAFLAGAVVVGSLMFTADKMNWFTGTPGFATGNQASQGSTYNQGSGNGGVKTVNYDIERPGNIPVIVQQSSPAVVKIETYAKARSRSTGNSSSFLDDPFFRQFFGDQFGQTQPRTNERSQEEESLQQVGMGSGFIYKDSGYILTNQHVIGDADEVQVTVQGYSKKFKAEVLGSSFDYDLAVLKIEGDKPFPTLPLGDADAMNVGDWVIAIGNPYGFDHTVTVGVLSAKERPVDIPDRQGQREYRHLLQTDASINPGNSGGPLLNLNGAVIGINTAVSAQAQGIGFAIPTTTVHSLLERLEKNEKIPKEPAPFIGVALQDIDKSWVSDLKLKNTDGALIASVERGTPAFAGGMRQYDVVIAMNGEKISNSQDLQEKVKGANVGDKITFTVIRDGNQMDIQVTVGNRNEE